MNRLTKLRIFLLGLLLLAALAGAGFYSVFAGLPLPESLSQRLNTPSVRITDRNGRLLYEDLAEDAGRHTVVPLEAIPVQMQQATIATEDRSFYTNPGVDGRGILRALWINLRGGETLAGGSTITQQVARTLLMDADERSQRILRRKLRESYLAWRLARRFSKEEILALYLNQIYYGAMAYGVEAAAQTYFGKPAADLDLAECALLAGLPQSPAAYNPFTNPEAAKERQGVVLRLMEEDGFISAEQRQQAGREPLAYASTPYPIEAPHFVMMARGEVDRLFTPEQIYQAGGLTVRTTLDLDWQKHAERAVAKQIEALRQSEDGLGHNVNSAALVALDPQTGEVLALVGSPDYFDATHAGAINMALAPRQPGSSIKPLVYAAALDPGRLSPWTTATVMLDVRTSFLTRDGKSYTPTNYDSLEHGPVSLREALGSSLNIPAVLALDRVGLEPVFTLAERLGMTTLVDPQRYDLSLALGGGEVRLIELTAAYAAFDNGGYRVRPAVLLEVTDPQGNVLYSTRPERQERALDERVAWLVSDILSDNDARLLGFGPNSILRLDRPAAVKTGTTSNFHDNWTVGYTPDLVVGVWAGNTDYQPMREVTGLTGAAPIWHQFMRSVLSGRPEQSFPRPDGLVQTEICTLSGLLPTEACPYRRLEWFIEGTQPVESDHFYKTVTLDRATGRLAGDDTPPERRVQAVALDLPAEAQPWARRQGLTLMSDLLAASGQVVRGTGGRQASTAEAALRLTSPGDLAIYRLQPGFSAEAQQVQVQAVGQAGLREVSLWVDGAQIKTTVEAPYTGWWPLKPGRHQAWAEGVTVEGERVRSRTVSFEVK